MIRASEKSEELAQVACRQSRHPKMTKDEKNKFRWGMFFIGPQLIGLAIFVFIPMIFSLVMSFMEWDIVSPPTFIGWDNYKFMIEEDEYVPISLKITVMYTMIQVPCGVMYTLFIAMLLNTKIRSRSLFRTIFYLPSIVPAVATAALWIIIFNPNSGVLNSFLEVFGVEPQLWLYDEKQVLIAFLIMSLWGSGGGIITNLAALQGVPTHLQESMELDGANAWHRFWHLTVPMVSPVIFYNVIMGIIGNLQGFSQSYLMTGGGPNNSSLFYMLHLYRNAFQWGRMGYACAMAWVLFLVIAVFTAIAFFIGNKKVYYEGG